MANQKARLKVVCNDITKLNSYIERVLSSSEKLGVKVKGPIPTPTKRLKVNVRKSPCGDGKGSFEKYEMRIHKRILDFEMNDRVLRQITKISIPYGVNIELKLV